MPLNIYPQEKLHDEAVIIGSRESLRMLRDALTIAIDLRHCNTTMHASAIVLATVATMNKCNKSGHSLRKGEK